MMSNRFIWLAISRIKSSESFARICGPQKSHDERGFIPLFCQWKDSNVYLLAHPNPKKLVLAPAKDCYKTNDINDLEEFVAPSGHPVSLVATVDGMEKHFTYRNCLSSQACLRSLHRVRQQIGLLRITNSEGAQGISQPSFLGLALSIYRLRLIRTGKPWRQMPLSAMHRPWRDRKN